MRILIIIFLFLSIAPAFGQKMLLLERANQAKTTKMYIGDRLHFRLAGEEDYWYRRTITDMLSDKNTLLLDSYAVELGDISAVKVHRRGIWRIVGGTLFSFGISLAVATTVAAIDGNKETNYGALYAVSAGSLGVGYFLNTKRTLHLGDKHRLRLVEVKFPEPPLIPPPASKQ